MNVFLCLEELVRVVVSHCEIQKMVAFGCGASEHMKTWVTFDVWWSFMRLIEKSIAT
jgi:hypothetical protein